MKSKHGSPILVTGAAGAIGAIGRNLAAMLLAKGHKVRALVRREDARADALRRLGAEVVLGDLTDLASMHRAIEGCARIYFRHVGLGGLSGGHDQHCRGGASSRRRGLREHVGRRSALRLRVVPPGWNSNEQVRSCREGRRKSGSQRTRCWREMDSNFRFRASGDTPQRPLIASPGIISAKSRLALRSRIVTRAPARA